MKATKYNEDTGNYEPVNIDEQNRKVINGFKNTIDATSKKAIEETESLKSSLELYKSTIEDYINLSVEKSDIVAKYSKANNGGVYNLPGVFASSSGAYDISAMKQDNQRIEQVKSLYSSVDTQKKAYVKMIVRAQNEMQLYLRTLLKTANDLDVYLEQLSQDTSWASNTVVKK